MIGVSDRYKTNMVAPVKSVKVKLVEVVPDGQTPLELKSGDSLVSAKITAVGEFLGTGAKQLNAVLIGEFNQLQGKGFKAFIGIEDPATNETDWACQGEFRVETANLSIEKGTTEIVAYDAMTRAYKTEYANSLLSFPCTIKNLIEQVAGTFGLELDQTEIAKLPNINYTVKQDPYKKIKGATYRQILDELAQATGSTVIISCGKLLFKPYAEPVNSIDTNNMLTFKVGEKWGVPTKLALAREPQEDNTMLEDRELEKLPAGTNLLDTPTDGTVSQNGYTAKINPNGSFTITGKTEKGVDWCDYMTGRQNLSLPKGVYAFITDNPSPDVSNFLRFGMLAGGDKDFNIQKLQTGRLINAEWIVKNFYLFAGCIDKTKTVDYTTNLGLVKVNNKLLGTYEDLFDCEDTEVALDTYLEPWRDVAQQGMKLTKNEQTRRMVITGKPKTSWTLLQDNNTDKMNELLEDGAWYFFRNASDRSLVACALSVYDKEAKKTYYMSESQFFQVDKTKYNYRFYVETKNINAWTSADETPKEFACSLHKLKHPIRYERFRRNGSKDIKLVNNELLDDDRQALIQPLFDSLIKPAKIKMDELEIKTEGHGIYEVGDNITCKVNGETYNLNVSETRLELSGGIKETLICRPPKFNTTDRTTAGGIKQTIYNTELKTDRQQQEITAVVSKQEKSEQYNLEQFTQVKQDIHNIIQTVQVVGGGNLIKNSVGYGIDGQKNLVNWDYNHDTAKITSETSPASITAGALSGNQINLTASTMSQRLYVKSAEPHTLTARALKGIVGSGKIELISDLDHYVINLEDQKSYHWDEVALTFTPKMGWLDVKITADANSTFSITDLMLAGGDTKQPWRQSAGEIYNTQVSLDANGIQVRSSVYSGDYVEITPLEFSGYSTAGGQKRKVFTLNRDTTEVEKIKVRTQIDMPPIKIVPFQGDQNQGWAFVPNI